MILKIFIFSIKPFSHHGAFGLPPGPEVKPPTTMIAPQPPATPAWLGRSIATNRLRMLEHSAFVDVQADQENYQKHLFVHIGSSISYSDPLLEVSFSLKTIVHILNSIHSRVQGVLKVVHASYVNVFQKRIFQNPVAFDFKLPQL